MSEEEIVLKLKDIICNYIDIETEKINANMSFNSDLGIDSFSLVSLVCNIEDEFGIEIPDYELVNFQTLGDMISFIKSAN